jgi:hypothetical protein
MIDFKTDRELHKKAIALVRYIRSGAPHIEHVEDSYFSHTRWNAIFKRWNTLRSYDTPISEGSQYNEVFYILFCSQYGIDRDVRLGEWKSILGVVAKRLEFTAVNDLKLSTSTTMALNRLLNAAHSLKYGV